MHRGFASGYAGLRASDGTYESYAAWLRNPSTYGEDSFAVAVWADWEPGWLLGPWGAWTAAHPTLNWFCSVGMMPDSMIGTSSNWDDGIAGAFDSQWVSFTTAVVTTYAVQRVVVRLGWEFNLWTSLPGTPTASQFIAYWQRIVNVVRANDPGGVIKFCWNPNQGQQLAGPLEDYYPGDSYVDYIGIDLYDSFSPYYTAGVQPDATAQTNAMNGYLTQAYGLNWVASFASTHSKPLVQPEWGTVGIGSSPAGGDNPIFIQGMYDWFIANSCFWESYFDANIAGGWDSKLWPMNDGNVPGYVTAMPLASHKYIELFAGPEDAEVSTIKKPLDIRGAGLGSSGIPEWVDIAGSNFPAEGYAFDDTTQEIIYLKLRAEFYASGSLTIDLDWYSRSGSTTGNVVWKSEWASITPGTDAQNYETKAFATADTATGSAFGTAKGLQRTTIIVNNYDSLAAEDHVVIKLSRDAANGSDTMTGDAVLVGASLNYTGS